MMAYFYETLRHAPQAGVREIITCMPHRGRLNLLTTLLDFPAVIMFRKVKILVSVFWARMHTHRLGSGWA